ncbi:MAG: Trm112 family protein [Rhodoferax sp.]
MCPMDTRLLELLVCPVTKGPLEFKPETQELWSRSARLAYPVRDGIPILLENEARALSDQELGL